MTPTPELEAAVERLKEALDDFDRDLSDVIDDEAFNVGQDESTEVSTADLRLVLASLPTGDMASRDHAPGEQRQAETDKAEPVGHDGYGDCGGTGWVWVSDGDQSNFYEGGSCWRCRPRAATQSLPTGTGEGEWISREAAISALLAAETDHTDLALYGEPDDARKREAMANGLLRACNIIAALASPSSTRSVKP